MSDNTIVQQGLTWNGVRWAFTGYHVANYHPLTWLSHMLDCQLFGVDSAWHHRVNLLFHIANSILLLLVLRHMTGREGPSLFVAALFALHPQHVESVAWIAERKDVLSGLFWILALGAYTNYSRSRSLAWYIASLIAFALGLLSKPMVVTLPCVLLLLDAWPLGRTRWFAAAREDQSHLPRSLPFLLVEKVPFFLLAGASAVATMLAQSAGGAVASIEHMSLGFRIGNALVSYALYLRKFLWPTDLSAFYPLLRPWPLAYVAAAAALLLVITLASAFFWRKRPYIGVGWLWFLGTLVPVIGLVQVGNQAMADRYMYLPLIGLALPLAWLCAEFFNRRVASAAACISLVLLTSITMLDARAWRDSETLFTRAIERTEPNVFALHNIASSMLIRGETAGAIERFEQCVALQPGNPHVRRAYGFALRQAKRYEQAIEQLTAAIQIKPHDSRSWNAMGRVYFEQQNWEAAAEHFSVAVELKADDLESRLSLASAYHHNKQDELALEALRGALELNPYLAQPWYLCGALLLDMNRPVDAIQPLTRATSLDRRFADAHFRLGMALMRSGQGERAVAPLMRAVELAPQSSEPLTHLAWLLATHPKEQIRRGGDALFLATRARDLTQASSPQALDALAAALAEQENFDDAARTAGTAAALARQAGDATLAQQIEQRIRRYQSHQAMRDLSLSGADASDAVP